MLPGNEKGLSGGWLQMYRIYILLVLFLNSKKKQCPVEVLPVQDYWCDYCDQDKENEV